MKNYLTCHSQKIQKPRKRHRGSLGFVLFFNFLVATVVVILIRTKGASHCILNRQRNKKARKNTIDSTMCFPCCFIVSTAEVGVIETWGKYSRLVQPGLAVIFCPMDQLVGRLSFRVQQLNVRVETKTSDNVFITAVVSVQYQVLRDKVYEAFYALTNPAQQITAHVYDVMRSQLPNLELDSVFEAKEELAIAVKNALAETMTGYGYQIVNVVRIQNKKYLQLRAAITQSCLSVHGSHTIIWLAILVFLVINTQLITDLDPDQRVKAAMNEINSSKRLKYSVAERAEGDKILQVKAAEAEAEAKYLSGVGVAKQRKAIVDGLRTSIVDFADHVEGACHTFLRCCYFVVAFSDASWEIAFESSWPHF
jgi:regulator of protease activity HflC (stomatin/prohibitin superfamily)